MEFRTPVELPVGLPHLNHAHRILMMGSCFAEHIGALLAGAKFQTDLNPYGILYNPLSVSAALREIASDKRYTVDDLFTHQGLWHSPMHHGSFSALTSEEVLEAIHVRLRQAHERWEHLDRLILTMGTAYVYRNRDDGRIVGNCHRLPENRFVRTRLSVEEIVEDYTTLIAETGIRNPGLKWLFTVSPIRHVRDGMHANQLSKSTLLLAIDELCRRFPQQIFYFPSYELVMDELRDYRFYADDMVHPSSLAVRYLWERFGDTFFSAETRRVMEEVESIRRDLAHRPFRPEEAPYQRFLGQIVLKIERLTEKYPYLDFQKETELCHIRLNP